MASVVGIWNAALVSLGVDRVMSPTEDSETAKKCNEIYADVRDEETEMHPWNFAVTRKACALTATSPTYEYTYAYQVPSDCLRILEIETNEDDYQREGDLILTDVTSLNVKYIKQVTDANAMTPSFRGVLSARMKYELAYSLTGTKTMTLELYEVLKKIRKNAKAIDAQEGTPHNLHSNRIADARLGAVR